MAGFVRRFTATPPIEVIRQIEGVVIVDIAPPDPATGAGSGTVLLVGEFEDGAFATDEEAIGSVEVYGSSDFKAKFGSFGFTYDGVIASNPCARKHLLENWNGNGYLKAFKLRCQRLLISRVDTSVGSVDFDPLASLTATRPGPYALTAGQQLSVTTQAGTAASTALAAAVATVLGTGAAFATIVSGDAVAVTIDGGPRTVVTFGAADITVAAVVARFNSVLGYTAAVDVSGQIRLNGLRAGTGGSLVLENVATGTLAKLGLAAGTTAGTGTVANIAAVTATELAGIINATVALDALAVKADLDPSGLLRVRNNSAASTATLLIAATGLGPILAFSVLGTAVSPASHPAGVIAAGTRVRASSLVGREWVTTQTLDIPEGALGPFSVRVRPALDDGTSLGAGAGTINTIVDASNVGALAINNGQALTAALSETALDAAYQAALDATLDERGAAVEANYLLIARRSDAVVRAGRANAIKATECGQFGRKFITGDPLGTTINQAVANVAQYRSDRVFYTAKGLRVLIPEIAVRGTAGGIGFTADGIITVRPDGPLTTICATLPPEENPGQQTGLIDDFFQVNTFGETLDVEAYKAFRRAGIEVPRFDRQSGMIFQSGVTSSLESGRTTAARRKMADFIQDTIAVTFNPYVKRLSIAARRNKLRAILDQFLKSLLSPDTPDNARIAGYSTDDSVNAGNTPEVLAQGVFYIATRVRTAPSLDDLVFVTEVGPNAVVTTGG